MHTQSIDFILYLAAGVPILSAASFVLYGIDKEIAEKNERRRNTHDEDAPPQLIRVPEGSLLGLDAMGGWPGGWVGRRVFRHKTSKTSYVMQFWVSVFFHVAVCILTFALLFGDVDVDWRTLLDYRLIVPAGLCFFAVVKFAHWVVYFPITMFNCGIAGSVSPAFSKFFLVVVIVALLAPIATRLRHPDVQSDV